MSVTLEKRRKVAELENFERRIRQEKRRLLNELEGLERPFRNAQASGWIRDYSSAIAGGWRALGAAPFRAPVWFYIVVAVVLIGGGGLVAILALRGAPAHRADGATLRQVETPTTPARIEQATPAPLNEAAQTADAGPSSAPFVGAPPDLIAPPTPPTSNSKDLRERLREAESAAQPLPEPLPPPTRTELPAAAPALAQFRRSIRRGRKPSLTTRRPSIWRRWRSRTTRRLRRRLWRAKASARTSPRTKSAVEDASSRSTDNSVRTRLHAPPIRALQIHAQRRRRRPGSDARTRTDVDGEPWRPQPRQGLSHGRVLGQAPTGLHLRERRMRRRAIASSSRVSAGVDPSFSRPPAAAARGVRRRSRPRSARRRRSAPPRSAAPR